MRVTVKLQHGYKNFDGILSSYGCVQYPVETKKAQDSQALRESHVWKLCTVWAIERHFGKCTASDLPSKANVST